MQHPSRSSPTHTGTTPTATSRFFVSMRNPFGPPTQARRKATETTQRVAMYSTPEERHGNMSSRASRSHYLDSRPTIEQIAMGLHVSRTPHLRLSAIPLQRHPVPSHLPPYTTKPQIHSASASSADPHDPSPQPHTRHSLPPPPPRSSMKKTSMSASTLTQPRQLSSSGVSPSTSVVTSVSPPTPSPSRPLSFLRARVSKFIPGYRPMSMPSTLGRASSFTSSASDSTRPATPRKAVRFSTNVLGIDERL